MDHISFTQLRSFSLKAFWGSILCLSLVLSPSVGILAGNEIKVAFVMKALSNPFFSTMEAGAEKYAQRENIPLEIFGTEHETDVATLTDRCPIRCRICAQRQYDTRCARRHGICQICGLPRIDRF